MLEAHRRISESYGPVSANNELKFYRRKLNYANAAFGTKIDVADREAGGCSASGTRRSPERAGHSSETYPAIWEASERTDRDPWNRLLTALPVTGLRNREPLGRGQVTIWSSRTPRTTRLTGAPW